MNFGDQHYTRAVNEVDPQIRLAQQNALNQPVDNPFFNYLTPELFPGQLRNQRQVSLGLASQAVSTIRAAVHDRQRLAPVSDTIHWN